MVQVFSSDPAVLDHLNNLTFEFPTLPAYHHLSPLFRSDLEPSSRRVYTSFEDVRALIDSKAFFDFAVNRYASPFNFQKYDWTAEGYPDACTQIADFRGALHEQMIAPFWRSSNEVLNCSKLSPTSEDPICVAVNNQEGFLLGCGFFAPISTNQKVLEIKTSAEATRLLFGPDCRELPPALQGDSPHLPRERDIIELTSAHIAHKFEDLHSAAAAEFAERGFERLFASCVQRDPYLFVRRLEALCGFRCTILGISNDEPKSHPTVVYSIDLKERAQEIAP